MGIHKWLYLNKLYIEHIQRLLILNRVELTDVKALN
jgi:hypothetical protein